MHTRGGAEQNEKGGDERGEIYESNGVQNFSPFFAIAVRRRVEVNLVAIVVLSALGMLHAVFCLVVLLDWARAIMVYFPWQLRVPASPASAKMVCVKMGGNQSVDQGRAIP